MNPQQNQIMQMQQLAQAPAQPPSMVCRLVHWNARQLAAPFIGLAALAAQGTAAKDKGIHWWYENLRMYAPYAKSGNLALTSISIGMVSGFALVLIIIIIAIVSSMR